MSSPAIRRAIELYHQHRTHALLTQSQKGHEAFVRRALKYDRADLETFTRLYKKHKQLALKEIVDSLSHSITVLEHYQRSLQSGYSYNSAIPYRTK
jgi:hypothetical protein